MQELKDDLHAIHNTCYQDAYIILHIEHYSHSSP